MTVATIDEGVMTTTLAPIASSVGGIGEPTSEMYSAKWAVSARADIGGLPGSRLRRVNEYVRQNLDKALTLAELAGVVHMSPFHFGRLFKRSTGMPPHRFVVRQRIARACACLATPGLPITQISRMVGFRTASHFTTVFRRVTGVTPGGYRRGSLREDRPGPDGG